MPIVNYVNESKAFMEYAADNGLSGNEMLVWLALFHVMNQRANGVNFPDGFIRVKNDRLLTYAPMGYDALSRARNGLIQKGLISYVSGRRNQVQPMYEMHYLTANNSFVRDDGDNSGDNSESYPFKRTTSGAT